MEFEFIHKIENSLNIIFVVFIGMPIEKYFLIPPPTLVPKLNIVISLSVKHPYY